MNEISAAYVLLPGERELRIKRELRNWLAHFSDLHRFGRTFVYTKELSTSRVDEQRQNDD